MASSPVRVDQTSAVTTADPGAAVVFLVTLPSLPSLWRMMRPNGLRTE